MLRARLLLPLVAAALLAAPLSAQLPPDVQSRVDKLVRELMAEQRIPGLSIAIGRDNQIVYSKGFGMADLENNVSVATVTVFRTASIAKGMTATAAMQLVEAGRLDLDGPIQKYCPAFPQKQWPVTARHILGHQSGIRHYKPNESAGTEHFFTLADSLRLFKDDPLQHRPGEKFTYTSFGYSVLGCAIEGASGVTYEEYLSEKVLSPAGMERTRTDNQFLIIANRARGYQRLDRDTYNQLPQQAKADARVGEVYNASLHDTSMKIPGGGLLSTSEDLVRLVFALQSGKLVKQETLAQMWTGLQTNDGKPTSYGLGWNVPESQGGKLVLHTGGQTGVSTVLAIRTDKGAVVAIMANLQGVLLHELARNILDSL